MEKQADKVVILAIKKLSSVADYLLVCSADSERQVQAIARSIEDGLRKTGERPLSVEGVTAGKWALMDYNDVIVHIFLEHVRSFYDLEGLWAEAPSTTVKDKPKAKPEPKPKAPSTAVKDKPKAKSKPKPESKEKPKAAVKAKAPAKAKAAARKPAAKKKPKAE